MNFKTSILFIITGFFLFVGAVPCAIIFGNIWESNHPINAYVLAVSGEQLNTVQHKHRSTLESRYWIKIKSVDTNVEGSFYVENPFVADSYRNLIGKEAQILPNSHSIRNAIDYKNNYSFIIMLSMAIIGPITILIGCIGGLTNTLTPNNRN